MMRAHWLLTGCAAAMLLGAQTRKVTDAEVRKVHREAILIDTHNDVTGQTGFDTGPRAATGHTDLPRRDATQFPNLTRALLEKGYSAAQIRKIYGGNTLRLMRAVERTAQGMQTGSRR